MKPAHVFFNTTGKSFAAFAAKEARAANFPATTTSKFRPVVNTRAHFQPTMDSSKHPRQSVNAPPSNYAAASLSKTTRRPSFNAPPSNYAVASLSKTIHRPSDSAVRSPAVIGGQQANDNHLPPQKRRRKSSMISMISKKGKSKKGKSKRKSSTSAASTAATQSMAKKNAAEDTLNSNASFNAATSAVDATTTDVDTDDDHEVRDDGAEEDDDGVDVDDDEAAPEDEAKDEAEGLLVETICGHKWMSKTLAWKFLVVWDGYPNKADYTWERALLSDADCTSGQAGIPFHNVVLMKYCDAHDILLK